MNSNDAKIMCGDDIIDVCQIVYLDISSSLSALEAMEELINGEYYSSQIELIRKSIYLPTATADIHMRTYDARKKQRDEFLARHQGKSILTIHIEDKKAMYLEGTCGFDIFAKEREIKEKRAAYQLQRKKQLEQEEKRLQKQRNSNNPGEKTVEYALKWFIAASSSYVVSIQNDCESQHRYNCIMLCKPEFINAPQEYDHILVCPAGVVLIETKHWKGRIEIRPDGKWIRHAYDNDSAIGVESPKFQMRRHEVLMQNILPSIPVYSLLCFSNSSTIIDGREHFTEYPIMSVDQLEDTLTSLCAKGTYTKGDIDQIVSAIESHKLHTPEFSSTN